MEVLILNNSNIDEIKYRNLLNNSLESTPFVTHNFNSLFQNTFYIVAQENSEYLACLSGRIRFTKFPYNILGKSIWLEGAVIKNNKYSDTINEIELAVWENLREYAIKEKIIQVFLTHWSREEKFEILKKYNFKIERNCTFLINIEVDEDKLFKSFSEGHRRSIKAGEKKRVTVLHYSGNVNSDIINTFQVLREKTQKRAVKKNPQSSMQLKKVDFMDSLFNNFMSDAIISIAYYNSEPVATALVLMNKYIGYYYLGGSDYSLNLQSKASVLLHWEIMKYLKSLGYKKYDLGGIPCNPDEYDPAYGVFLFKKKYGGELKVYFTGKMIFKPIRYFLANNILKNKSILRLINKLESFGI